MPQIAQQEYLHYPVTGGLSDMGATTKAALVENVKNGTIFDCVIDTTTEGSCKVLGYHNTVSQGVVTKTEIVVTDCTTGTNEKVTIYQAAA